jgi:hypothetical protein
MSVLSDLHYVGLAAGANLSVLRELHRFASRGASE